ncbi:MAG TPA: F0F1 ATP synthase subunit delta [Candidatus Nanoarchaeia archaeon]
MNDKDLSRFLQGINDSDDLNTRLREVSDLLQTLRTHQNISINDKIDQVSKDLNEAFKDLEEKKALPANSAAQTDLLEKIINYLRKLPLLKLTLAFRPSNEFISLLANQLSALVKEQVVLDLSYEERIIGGLIIEFKGRYHDYSLAPKLSAFLKQKLTKYGAPEEISEKL